MLEIDKWLLLKGFALHSLVFGALVHWMNRGLDRKLIGTRQQNSNGEIRLVAVSNSYQLGVRIVSPADEVTVKTTKVFIPGGMAVTAAMIGNMQAA